MKLAVIFTLRGYIQHLTLIDDYIPLTKENPECFDPFLLIIICYKYLHLIGVLGFWGCRTVATHRIAGLVQLI